MPVQKTAPSMQQMLDLLGKTIQFAEDRLRFNESYYAFCKNCTEAEYQEFYQGFIPYITLSNGITTRLPVEMFSKERSSDSFEDSVKRYSGCIELIKQCPKDEESLQGTINDIFVSVSLWLSDINAGDKFVETMTKNYFIARDGIYTIRTQALWEKVWEKVKEFGSPEIIFIKELFKSLHGLASQHTNEVMEIMEQIDLIETERKLTPEKTIKAKTAITAKLQKRLLDLVNYNSKAFEYIKQHQIVATFVTDKDDVAAAEANSYALELVNLIFDFTEGNDTCINVYNLLVQIDSGEKLKSILRAEIDNWLQKLQKPQLATKETSALMTSSTTEDATAEQLELQLKLAQENEQQQRIEQAKQAAVRALNDDATRNRSILHQAKQQAYQQLLVKKEEEEIVSTERTAGAAPTQQSMPVFHILNKNNYEVLLAVFREEHNTIKYSELENLATCDAIKAVVTKPTGGGSSRKFTIQKRDIYILEPDATRVVGGLHVPHKPGHNKETLIRPIIKNFKAAFEKAGFTPATCKVKNDLSPTRRTVKKLS